MEDLFLLIIKESTGTKHNALRQTAQIAYGKYNLHMCNVYVYTYQQQPQQLQYKNSKAHWKHARTPFPSSLFCYFAASATVVFVVVVVVSALLHIRWHFLCFVLLVVLFCSLFSAFNVSRKVGNDLLVVVTSFLSLPITIPIPIPIPGPLSVLIAAQLICNILTGLWTWALWWQNGLERFDLPFICR